jgi:hypothetical protein
MSKLVTASIDVTKIVKSLLITGKKGTYLNLSIWFNDEPDQYGNDCSIQQTTKKDEPKIFLGNGKYYKKEEAPAQQTQAEIPNDDLPF